VGVAVACTNPSVMSALEQEAALALLALERRCSQDYETPQAGGRPDRSLVGTSSVEVRVDSHHDAFNHSCEVA
jgi:hypothetical protein